MSNDGDTTASEDPPRRRSRPPKSAFEKDLEDVQQRAVEFGLAPPTEEGNGEGGDDAEVRRQAPGAFGFPPKVNFSEGTPPTVTAEEIGLVKLLDEQIDKLRRDPQAFVSAWRVRPEFVEGKPAAGQSGKWSISSLRSAEDLLTQIEEESGGYVYQIRFTGYDAKKGKVTTLKTFGSVPINAVPLLRGDRDKGKGQNGNGHVLSPDVELSKHTNELLRNLVTDTLRDGGAQGRGFSELLKTMKESSDAQVQFLMKQLEDSRTRPTGPSSEVIAKIQEDAKRELERARERWEDERKQLLREHAAQVEKTIEKLEAAQKELRTREDAFSRERIDRDRSADERQKHRDELHQRDVESIRAQRDADVKRAADQLADERRSTEKLKDMYELAKKAELDKQEGIFREQLKGQENRIAHLEERIRDLEKQREELQKELLTARTTKSDPLSTAMETFGAVGKMASGLGWSRPGAEEKQPAGEMRTEIGQLAKDMKDSGVIDAAKGVVEKVATVIADRGRQQMPMQGMQGMQGMPGFPPGTFPIQVYGGGYPQQPMPMPMPMQPTPQFYPQPPAPTPPPPAPPPPAPPVQQAAPAPSPPPPAPQPEPEAPLTEAEIAGFAVAVKQLEEASDSGKPVTEVAKSVIADVPRLYLQDIVDAGATAFQDTVRLVLKSRPEDPESVLLTPRGDAWLRELFAEIRTQMG